MMELKQRPWYLLFIIMNMINLDQPLLKKEDD